MERGSKREADDGDVSMGGVPVSGVPASGVPTSGERGFMDKMTRFLDVVLSRADAAAPAPRDKTWEDRPRCILEEKNFRRIERFDGEVSKFRTWKFDLAMAIGQVDSKFAVVLDDWLSKVDSEVTGLKWNPKEDSHLDRVYYDKYTADLYGVLASLTGGEAKSLVRGVCDAGLGRDGYRALLILHRRYEVKTQASRLQAFMEVVNPPGIKNLTDIVPGINRWGSKLLVFKEPVFGGCFGDP